MINPYNSCLFIFFKNKLKQGRGFHEHDEGWGPKKSAGCPPFFTQTAQVNSRLTTAVGLNLDTSY